MSFREGFYIFLLCQVSEMKRGFCRSRDLSTLHGVAPERPDGAVCFFTLHPLCACVSGSSVLDCIGSSHVRNEAAGVSGVAQLS